MSDATHNPTPTSGSTAGTGGTPPNPAQQAFGKYRTRLAAQPMAMGMGWPMPPSTMMLGEGHQGHRPGPHPLGSLSERLGSTVRLSVDLLNAALFNATNMLGALTSLERRQYGREGGCGCDCGCGQHSCGCKCCGGMDVECCRPGVHGCGCC